MLMFTTFEDGITLQWVDDVVMVVFITRFNHHSYRSKIIDEIIPTFYMLY